MNDRNLEIARLRYGGTGLALVGVGLSVAMDAGAKRMHGVAVANWVARGTIGLCLVGAGLSLFGEAVAYRALQLRSLTRTDAGSGPLSEAEA